MPVEEHEVHHLVRISADKPYGCHSREALSGGYWVKQRVYIDGDGGKFEHMDKFVPFRMSSGCRNFYIWDTDPRCGGCAAPKDNEYADKMKELS